MSTEWVQTQLADPYTRFVFGLTTSVIAFVVFWVLVEPTKYVSAHTRQGQRNRKKVRRHYINVSSALYDKLSSIGFMHIFVHNIFYMFKTRYCMADIDAKVAAGRTLFFELLTFIVTLVAGLFLLKDMLLGTMISVISCFIVMYFIRGNSLKFIENLNELIGDMLHMYNSGGHNIQNMFEKLDEINNSMSPYVKSMRKYLIDAKYSNEPDMVIAEYHEICPSRFLRIMFNYIYITEKYGDADELFNTNMMALQREVHAEQLNIQQLSDAMMTDLAFVVAPLLSLPVMEWYMKNYFVFGPNSFVMIFLSTSAGYVVKILCAVVTLICFYCYYVLMTTSDTALEVKQDEDWADHHILNNRKLYKTMEELCKRAPKLISNVVADLQEFNSGKVNLSSFYLKSIVFGAVFFTVTSLVVTTDTLYQRYTIDNSISAGIDEAYLQLAIDSANEGVKEFTKRSLENDRIMLEDLAENGIPENIVFRIRELGLDYGVYIELAGTRVMEKFTLLSHMNTPMLVLIILVMTAFGAAIPLIDLGITVRLKKSSMLYNEVMGFYTVTILLISHPQSTIFMLIQWLTQFSSIFRQKLQACVDDFTVSSISRINRNIEYVPLNRLIDCIILAKNGISVDNAFAGIAQRYRFQEEERALVNAKVIKARTWMSSTITWISLGVSFGLYMLLPMIITIYTMLQEMNTTF